MYILGTYRPSLDYLFSPFISFFFSQQVFHFYTILLFYIHLAYTYILHQCNCVYCQQNSKRTASQQFAARGAKLLFTYLTASRVVVNFFCCSICQSFVNDCWNVNLKILVKSRVESIILAFFGCSANQVPNEVIDTTFDHN